MAALFDLHVLAALQNGWQHMTGATSTTANGQTNFRRCFPFVEDAVVDEWFDGLVVDNTVAFRSYASPGADQFPVCVVQLQAERQHGQGFLGDAQFELLEGSPSKHKGRYITGMVVEQEVDLVVATSSHELTRAMFTVIRSLMVRLIPQFLSAGYLSVDYLSSMELAPEDRLAAEDAGVFTRHMRWRALAQIEAYPIEDGTVQTGKPWYVLSSDIVSSVNPSPPPARIANAAGTPGGVTLMED